MLPVLAIVIGACTFGEWDDSARLSPRGQRVEFRVGGEAYTGELLTADSVGILVLLRDGPGTATWSDVERFRLPNLSVVRVDDGEAPLVQHMERIRLAARYPWGLTAEQLREVRARSGWAEVREIGR